MDELFMKKLYKFVNEFYNHTCEHDLQKIRLKFCNINQYLVDIIKINFSISDFFKS